MEERRNEEVKKLIGSFVKIDGSQYKVVDIFPNFFQDPGMFCQQQAFRPVLCDPFPQWETATAILWDTGHKVACSYHKKAGDVPALYFDESDVRPADVRTDVRHADEEQRLYSVGYYKNDRRAIHVGFMTEREAEAAAVSLFTRLHGKVDNVFYQFMFEPVIHFFSNEGWHEVSAIKIEEVESEIIES